jgi:hypothetical protein
VPEINRNNGLVATPILPLVSYTSASSTSGVPSFSRALNEGQEVYELGTYMESACESAFARDGRLAFFRQTAGIDLLAVPYHEQPIFRP